MREQIDEEYGPYLWSLDNFGTFHWNQIVSESCSQSFWDEFAMTFQHLLICPKLISLTGLGSFGISLSFRCLTFNYDDNCGLGHDLREWGKIGWEKKSWQDFSEGKL